MTLYDVIVIGSGAGGLETAAILSKKGLHVLVLEKSSAAGGATATFKVGNCNFNAGMHYAGCLDKGQTLYKIFSWLGIYSRLKLKQLDKEGFDRFYVGNDTFRYPAGYDAFEKEATERFPKEKVAVGKFLKTIREVADYQDYYNLRTPVTNHLFDNPYFQINFYDYVCSLTNDKGLRNWLSALNFVHAGEKKTTPLYTYALILDHYLKGAWRFVGGSGQLPELLSQVIVDKGGEVLTGKKVEKLVFKGDDEVIVKMEQGEYFVAKNVISDIHPAETLKLIESKRLKPAFRNRISKLENTVSGFALYICLKEPGISYKNYNEHHFSEKNVWPVSSYDTKRWPQFYFLHYHTPDEHNKTKGVTVLTYMKYDDVPLYGENKYGNKGKEYLRWKEERAQRLLDWVYRDHPELKGNIEKLEIATPLTFEHYLNNPRGSLYGVKRDFNNALQSYILPNTHIPNLFFTGQNINLHGLIGVSMSALVTVSNFLDINELIEEINAC